MEVTKKTKGAYEILGIKGSLDMNNVKFIKKIFDDSMASGIKIVAIDMSSLTYIDSSGIGSFISLVSKVKPRGGSVILMTIRDEVFRIFQMTKLTGFFKIFKNELEFEQKLKLDEMSKIVNRL